MADDRYRESWRGERGRSGSIFSDEDRGRSREWRPEEYGWGPGGRGSDERSRRGGRDEDRGFFERASDEVRSWFSDDDRERGRDRGRGGSSSRSSYGGGTGGDYRSNRSGGAFDRDRSGGSHFDDNYRRWRDRQIEQLDREYEDYCRDRQQRFESDFDSWRQSRESGRSGSTATGDAARSGGTVSGTSAVLGTDETGATTGGGRDPAMESSTGGGSRASGRGRKAD